MSETNTSLSLTQELKLRHWARENYVAPEFRQESWHPIVLQEMTFRDQELEEQQFASSAYGFVPLDPDKQYYLDEAHAEVPKPKIMAYADRQRISEEVEVGFLDYEWY